MEIKPLAGLTKMLRVLFVIVIVITVIAILAGFYQYHSYNSLPSDVDLDEVILPADGISAIVGLIQAGFGLFLVITFFVWIYRTNKNLGILSGEQMTFTPGWSVGWFFVPILCLYKPYQVMKEIWNVCHKNQSTNYSLIGWWWFLWITSVFLARFTFKLAIKSDFSMSYIDTIAMYIMSDGLDLILNIVELVLVTQIWIAYSKNIVEPTAAQNVRSDDISVLSVK